MPSPTQPQAVPLRHLPTPQQAGTLLQADLALIEARQRDYQFITDFVRLVSVVHALGKIEGGALYAPFAAAGHGVHYFASLLRLGGKLEVLTAKGEMVHAFVPADGPGAEFLTSIRRIEAEAAALNQPVALSAIAGEPHTPAP